MNVVLCGAPLTGKLEIIKSVSRVTKASISYVEQMFAQFVYLYTPKITLIGVTGAVFYTKVYEELLKNADIVCYIFCVNYDINSQLNVFNDYCSAAKAVNKSYEQVPWVLVLNKIDLNQNNPFINMLPVKNNFLYTAAIKDIGIKKLWEVLNSFTES